VTTETGQTTGQTAGQKPGHTAGQKPGRRDGGRRKAPTILDVARRAGVSKSLVSLVMQGSPLVSDQRRDAVLRAAEELGYRPNAVARSLARKRTNVLGVMLSDLHNPFFAEVVDGVQSAASEGGYHALIDTGQRAAAGELEAIETLLELRIDGLILAAPMLPGPDIVDAARATPVVLIARPSRWPSVDSVTNDDHHGAMLAVGHLVGLGHRRIAHVDGGRGAGANARRRGYRDAMRGHGLDAEMRVATGAYTEDGGAAGIEALLSLGAAPTAIFVANDLAAVGAMHALEQHGLRVPDDVSLVGYDNTSLAALGHIALTTIDQPRHRMGAAAVRMLLERIEGTRSRASHQVIAPTLVARATSAPPGRRARVPVRPGPLAR
jgi:DNA-binding LacI/PurR family transcriptional regulator